ncbi:SRPBCC domain-containing protein [Sphingobacterium sp. lm-10]|uniref:SRPBCC domain-containing protein n=1 Tax=Sphingobacterium sp. lm-10 TaxID=2944904 RepID=UPI002022758C|nr:SRPBCC domain-containing protein [Sphingobacterium sp. lm-10]MCL7988149.1 SRPBCC domain-containing protein [Sphingobacterium sp. lm-10]
MDRLNYTIDIHAPIDKVAATMIDRKTYQEWTKPFSSTSDFEGGWNKGDKICFTSLDRNGEKHGMLAEIVEHDPNEFISIHHYGMLQNGKKITEGPEVAGWDDAFENYYYEQKDGVTTVRVEVSDDGEYADHMNKTWPKALEILKAICEV